MQLRLNLLIQSATVVLCVGCAPLGMHNLAFLPAEPISHSTSDRIEMVYASPILERPLEARIADAISNEPMCPLGAVGIDGDEHRLLVYQRLPCGPRAPGFDTIQLRTGQRQRVAELPVAPSMGYVGAAPSRSFRHFGASSVRVTDNPVINENTILVVLENESIAPTTLVSIDPNQGEVVRRTEIVSEWKQVSFRGGIGDHILGWRQDDRTRRSELVIINAASEPARTEMRLPLADGWRPCSDAVDWKLGRWIVSEASPSCDAQTESRVRAYDVPSMDIAFDLPAEDFVRWRRMKCLSGGSLLLIVADGDPRTLKVIDTRDGSAICQLDLSRVGSTDVGTWIPFGDDKGRYVGVVGSHWVVLFAVRPKAATGK